MTMRNMAVAGDAPKERASSTRLRDTAFIESVVVIAIANVEYIMITLATIRRLKPISSKVSFPRRGPAKPA